MLIALMSLFRFQLSLPGIAGIVLTVGMAVDANVLIFERIREELRNGNTPQSSIRAGFDHAYSTIVDANVTTFIAGFVLFFFGSGPVKGFAVTMTLGIVTSMFTSVTVTRAMVNLVYGGRPHLKYDLDRRRLAAVREAGSRALSRALRRVSAASRCRP